MKKLLSAVLLSLFISSGAYAQEFFRSSSGQWDVIGIAQVDNVAPNCQIKTNWVDGSHMALVQDLADGEIYFGVYFKKWNLVPSNNPILITVKFDGPVGTIPMPFAALVTGIKMIRIPEVPFEPVVPMFAMARNITIEVPGSPVAVAGLKGTKEAMGLMSQCLNKAKELKIGIFGEPEKPKKPLQDTKLQ